ncbi:A74 [Sulfolobus spindle-shaped virus Lassen]|nr:A74 [Sulfolobus spindle-shaped virus Lassen]
MFNQMPTESITNVTNGSIIPIVKTYNPSPPSPFQVVYDYIPTIILSIGITLLVLTIYLSPSLRITLRKFFVRRK